MFGGKIMFVAGICVGAVITFIVMLAADFITDRKNNNQKKGRK